MCNRYVSPGQADIERFFEIGRRKPAIPWPAELYRVRLVRSCGSIVKAGASSSSAAGA